MKEFEVFSKYAHEKGYKYALCGSYLYRKYKTKLIPYIELISTRKGKMIVFESGKGRYSIDY